MNSEQYALSFTRSELLELHRALLSRVFVEDELRREKGLEEVGERPLISKIETLLRLGSDEAHRLVHEVDDELWEYGWYVVTDEWAWFRALQEERRALGPTFDRMDEKELRVRVERRYQKEFERFVREIEMKEMHPSESKKTRATKRK